jgi:isoquinoline 1-oxidoreductase subunit beta
VAEQRRSPHTAADEPDKTRGLGRRRFLGYLIAAPTLAVAVDWVAGSVDPRRANASIPTLPEPEEIFDLGDLQNLAAAPTSGLITVQVNPDGTAFFAVPRTEVGQGMTTAIAMMVADELDIPMDKVTIGLADARPELLMNQLTGGSNSMRSMYLPVRTAAAIARQRLVETAAASWGVAPSGLTTSNGVVSGPNGRTATYGSLATAAASASTVAVGATLKSPSQFTILGTPRNRIDALAAVTGRKQFGMDIRVPNAKPTMVARPPTINGTVVSVNNAATVRALPGITDVVAVTHGVAVRGDTFGQCIDAIQVLDVTWGPGTVDGESDDTVAAKLRAAQLPCRRRWPAPSTPSSPSRSPATLRWNRTTRSPTSAPTARRSGPA